MLDTLPPAADDDHSDRQSVNNQSPPNDEAPYLEAFGARFEAPPDEGAVQGGIQGDEEGAEQPNPTIDLARLTARDRAMVQSTVLLRLLTYDQLHRLAFPTVQDRPTVRRRIRLIERAGWIKSWEAPTRVGGHMKYAHPTKAALRSVLPACAAATAREPWAPLANLMVPRSPRRSLELGTAPPKWLAHQREVNHLVTSIATAPDRRIVWMSSWDCPFPSRFGMFTLPQPDYVLIEDVDGVPRLIFGEHDRASEPVDRFLRRKVALYSALAAFPEVCEQLFGLRTFQVYVTTIDPITQHPIARLRALIEATRAHGGPDIFRFALGGWLYADPTAPIWLPPTATTLSESAAREEHAPTLIAA
jgi:hypothetical protein